ncbi:hypothetical protein A3Q35_10410 [Aeribacillus pallidus]|nr:hypothetical protein A3Q35_10410 [Aeribacillus pallidus]
MQKGTLSPFYFSSHFSGKVLNEGNIHMYSKTALSKLAVAALCEFPSFYSKLGCFETLISQIPYVTLINDLRFYHLYYFPIKSLNKNSSVWRKWQQTVFHLYFFICPRRRFNEQNKTEQTGLFTASAAAYPL